MQRKPLKRTQMAKPMRGYWTCQRKRGGVKCGHVNPNRKQKCEKCEGKKRPKSTPKHKAVLKTMTHEDFAEIQGTEVCGICAAPPKARRLHRDHDHLTGLPRGLLCFPCNAVLRERVTLEWAYRLVKYLERAEEFNAPADDDFDARAA